MSNKNSMTQARRRAIAEMRATENQRKQLARRKALGVALIQRPLRFIKSRVGGGSWLYEEAQRRALAGSGDWVKGTARSVL